MPLKIPVVEPTVRVTVALLPLPLVITPVTEAVISPQVHCPLPLLLLGLPFVNILLSRGKPIAWLPSAGGRSGGRGGGGLGLVGPVISPAGCLSSRISCGGGALAS